MIPMNECKHGFLYNLKSRNLSKGVCIIDDTNPIGRVRFIGIRTKFHNRYLDCEYHYDSNERFGTATPLKELEECPIKDLREYLGLHCNVCDREATPFREDGLVSRYIHVDDRAEVCGGKYNASLKNNEELFVWLSVAG